MQEPLDVQQSLMAMLAPQHRPEGVSVRVVGDLSPVSILLAALEQYPAHEFTGAILFFGEDELAPGEHEIVLEVR